MSISNYAELAMLNATGRNVAFQVAQLYVKLHTGDPGEDGTANAATETTRKAATFSAAASGAMATSSALTWTAVSTTETFSYWSGWDASSAGNCLWTGALSSPVAATAGDNVQIDMLTLSLD